GRPRVSHTSPSLWDWSESTGSPHGQQGAFHFFNGLLNLFSEKRYLLCIDSTGCMTKRIVPPSDPQSLCGRPQAGGRRNLRPDHLPALATGEGKDRKERVKPIVVEGVLVVIRHPAGATDTDPRQAPPATNR